jgi:hypothetical protein
MVRANRKSLSRTRMLVTFSLPVEAKDMLREVAQRESRSMSSMVEVLIRQAFREPQVAAAVEALLERPNDEIARVFREAVHAARAKEGATKSRRSKAAARGGAAGDR